MDDLETPREPVALFEGPTLRFFRGWKLVGLIFASVAVGAALQGAVRAAADAHAQRERLAAAAAEALPIVPLAPAPAMLPRSTLGGPGGSASLPPGQPTLINVWLEGCRDCMPAFEAWRDLHQQGRVPAGVHIINVAYGQASPSFAAAYGLSEHLLFDRGGSAVVNPLGIGTFTTLVVDAEGRIRMRDRPDSVGFVERLQGAFAVLATEAKLRPSALGPTSSTAVRSSR
jgi:hypothetical protein